MGEWQCPCCGHAVSGFEQQHYALRKAAHERLVGALTQALGLIVEFGDLNGFRNLSDAELGASVMAVAKEAAAALSQTEQLGGFVVA